MAGVQRHSVGHNPRFSIFDRQVGQISIKMPVRPTTVGRNSIFSFSRPNLSVANSINTSGDRKTRPGVGRQRYKSIL